MECRIPRRDEIVSKQLQMPVDYGDYFDRFDVPLFRFK